MWLNTTVAIETSNSVGEIVDYIVEGEFSVEKFTGKGGWTYVALPGVTPDAENPYGWVIVSGTIDDVTLQEVKLMPKGDGQVFLALSARLRKQLGKEAGSRVYLKLYLDDKRAELPQEIKECFAHEPKECFDRFIKWPLEHRQARIAAIYQTKNPDERALRIVQMMDELRMMRTS